MRRLSPGALIAALALLALAATAPRRPSPALHPGDRLRHRKLTFAIGAGFADQWTEYGGTGSVKRVVAEAAPRTICRRSGK